MKTPKDKMVATLQLWLYEVVNMIEPQYAESVCIDLRSLRKHYNSRAGLTTFGKHLPTVVLTVRHKATCVDRAMYCEVCETMAFAVTLVPPAAHALRRGLAVKAQHIETSEVDWRPTHRIPEDDYA